MSGRDLSRTQKKAIDRRSGQVLQLFYLPGTVVLRTDSAEVERVMTGAAFFRGRPRGALATVGKALAETVRTVRTSEGKPNFP